ncbi:MAG: hypothetical protein HDT28_01435 [Clostridiales bacterium]|nr:hypothetical protein [Clostridiales bacterium]
MVKHSKRSILAIILTLCAALCFGLLAACSDEPTNQAETYTITVTADDGTPVKGVEVTVNKGGASFDPKTTGEDGKVSFELLPDDYELSLNKLPDGYEEPADSELKLNATDRDYTIKLNRKFAYVVNLVNQDGTPFTVEGNYQVGICYASDASNCLQPVTPVNGVARIEADKDSYHVQIIDLPEGYIFEGYELGQESSYYTGADFSETVTEMTIKIYKLNTIDLSKDGMTDTEKKAFAASNKVHGFDTARKAYNIKGDLKPGESVYYVLTPELTGMYNLHQNDEVTGEQLLNYYYSQTFKVSGTPEEFIPTGRGMNLVKGNTYYIYAANEGNTTVKLNSVLDIPYNSYLIYSGVGGTLELTVGKADTNAIIEFNPNAAGKYTLTVKSDVNAYVASTTVLPSETPEKAPADDDEYAKNASAEIDYSATDFSQKATVYYAVAVKADSYPVTISVELKKSDESEKKYEYAEVKDTLTKFADKQAGTTLIGVPMDGSAELVYDDENQVYTYNGKVVVVNITGNLDTARYADGGSLAYLGTEAFTASPLYTYVKDTTTTDYTLFLRGFDEYDYVDGRFGPTPVIPDKSEYKTQNCYANFVNADGVYPLTNELKDFLEKFYETNYDLFYYLISEDADLECGWMFPLYYYDVEPEADVIVGEYKFVKHVYFDEVYNEETDDFDKVKKEVAVGDDKRVWDQESQSMITVAYTDEEYRLVVKANGQFSIEQQFGDEGEYDEVESGSWKNEDGVYTFTVPDGWVIDADNWVTADLVYTVTFDSEAGTIKLVGSDQSEWQFIA